MLRVIDIFKTNDVVIEYDDYIPFIVRFPEVTGFPPFYWRCGDFENSLFEMGFHNETHAISKVSLVIYPKRFTTLESEPMSDSNIIEEGIPIIDADRWEDKTRIDENINFRVLQSNDSIFVMLSDDKIERQVSIKNISFGINSNKEISIFAIRKLDLDVMNNIQKALGIY